MLHLTFRIYRDRELDRLSTAHPRARMVAWCNLRNDVIEVQAESPQDADALARGLVAGHGARAIGPARDGQGEPRNFLMTCAQRPEGSLSLCVERHGGIVLPPIVIEDGWETFRVALFDAAKVQPFLAELRGFGPFEVLRKRSYEQPSIQEEFMLSSAELLGGLTRKQAEALLAALESGYYRVPRTANMVEIARRRGLPRTTLEEHVRKAEAKLVTAVAPFLELRVVQEGGAPRKDPRRAKPPVRRPPRTRRAGKA